MHLYRITHPKYKASTLTGIGAEKYGGRWNEVGTAAVYCSEHISLAFLEYYIHSFDSSHLPASVLVAKIFVPDDFEITSLPELPQQWDRYPYGSASAEVFTRFAQGSKAFALRVPSAIIPMEYNVILNPKFKDFSLLKIADFIDIPMDIRFSKST